MSAVVARVVDVLELVHGMHPILFRAPGGMGVHLYLIWDEAQDAYSVRCFMKGVLESVGLKDGARGVRAGRWKCFPVRIVWVLMVSATGRFCRWRGRVCR